VYQLFGNGVIFRHRVSSCPIRAKLLLWTDSTFRKTFVGMSKFWKSNLIFVDPWVKINSTYCHYVHAVEWAATAYYAWDLWQVLCLLARQWSCTPCLWDIRVRECETPAFITRHVAPDLNTVDYRIWGEMQQRLFKSKVHDVNEQCCSSVCYVWRAA